MSSEVLCSSYIYFTHDRDDNREAVSLSFAEDNDSSAENVDSLKLGCFRTVTIDKILK